MVNPKPPEVPSGGTPPPKAPDDVEIRRLPPSPSGLGGGGNTIGPAPKKGDDSTTVPPPGGSGGVKSVISAGKSDSRSIIDGRVELIPGKLHAKFDAKKKCFNVRYVGFELPNGKRMDQIMDITPSFDTDGMSLKDIKDRLSKGAATLLTEMEVLSKNIKDARTSIFDKFVGGKREEMLEKATDEFLNALAGGLPVHQSGGKDKFYIFGKFSSDYAGKTQDGGLVDDVRRRLGGSWWPGVGSGVDLGDRFGYLLEDSIGEGEGLLQAKVSDKLGFLEKRTSPGAKKLEHRNIIDILLRSVPITEEEEGSVGADETDGENTNVTVDEVKPDGSPTLGVVPKSPMRLGMHDGEGPTAGEGVLAVEDRRPGGFTGMQIHERANEAGDAEEKIQSLHFQRGLQIGERGVVKKTEEHRQDRPSE
jgi:hypothetical protein